MNRARFQSLEGGKHQMGEPNDQTRIIQVLLQKASYSETLPKLNNNIGIASSAKGSMQVHNIATPIKEFTTATTEADNHMVLAADDLQGLGDPWQSALGHESLNDKIQKWAQEVVNGGKWPKPPIINGAITDVRAVVAAEVERIKQRQQQNIDHDDGNDKMNSILDAIPTTTSGKQSSAALQNSPTSMSSNGIGNDSNIGDVGDQILAQLGFGMGGNGGGGGDGDDHGDSNIGTIHNDAAGRANATRRNECTLVNPRNITITSFSGRNFNTTTYLPFGVRHDSTFATMFWMSSTSIPSCHTVWTPRLKGCMNQLVACPLFLCRLCWLCDNRCRFQPFLILVFKVFCYSRLQVIYFLSNNFPWV